MQRVMHGDFVLAQPAGLIAVVVEVRIVRVLESRKNKLSAVSSLENGFSYVVPDDSRIGRDILVPNEHRNGARMGQVVVVELRNALPPLLNQLASSPKFWVTIWQRDGSGDCSS